MPWLLSMPEALWNASARFALTPPITVAQTVRHNTAANTLLFFSVILNINCPPSERKLSQLCLRHLPNASDPVYITTNA